MYPSPSFSQLAVVPEYNIFLGLADGEIFYADLEHFHILGHLSRSKGASYFAVDWQKLRAHGVGYGKGLRVCVATKRRLQLYSYQRGIFVAGKVRMSSFSSLCFLGENCSKFAKMYHTHSG